MTSNGNLMTVPAKRSVTSGTDIAPAMMDEAPVTRPPRLYIALATPGPSTAAKFSSEASSSESRSSSSPAPSAKITPTTTTSSQEYSAKTAPFDLAVAAAAATMVEDKENKVEVSAASHSAATTTTWRIEFRGVSKLVRWVSSKRSPTRNSNELPDETAVADGEKLGQAELSGGTPSTNTSTSTSTASRKLVGTRGRLRSNANGNASLDNHDGGNDSLDRPAPTSDSAGDSGTTSIVVKRLSFRQVMARSLSMTSSSVPQPRGSSRSPASAPTQLWSRSPARVGAPYGSAREESAHGPGPQPTVRLSSRSSFEMDGGRRCEELQSMVRNSDGAPVTRDIDGLVFPSASESPQQRHGEPYQRVRRDGQASSNATAPPRRRKLSKPRAFYPGSAPKISYDAAGNANPSSMTLPLQQNVRGSLFSFGRQKSVAASESRPFSSSSSSQPQLPTRTLRRQSSSISKQSYSKSVNVYSTPHLVSLQPSFLAPPDVIPPRMPPHPRPQPHMSEGENVALDMMRPPKPLFHLHDNGAESGSPSRTWSAEDIVFGGPPTPPSAAAHERNEDYTRGLRSHDNNEPSARGGGLPPMPSPLHSRRGRRLTAVVTEIADDRDFLRELNRELALATRDAAEEHMYVATGLLANDDDDRLSPEEEDHHDSIDILPRHMAVSEDGHGIGRRGVDGANASHAQASTSSVPTPLPAPVRPPLPSPLPPGRGSHPEPERLDMARKAMMCAREIVRTERSYLAHLCSAGEREISRRLPVASIFFEHLPRLIAVSKVFNMSLERDASIWGVAASFVSCAPQLETALVKWSAVVGNVITSPELASSSSSCSPSRNSSTSSSSLASSPLSLSSASSLPSTKPPTRASSSHSVFGGRRASGGQRPQLLSSPATTAQPHSLGATVSEDGDHHSSAPSPPSRPSRSLTHIPRGGGYLNPWKRSSAPPAPHAPEGNNTSIFASAGATPTSATRTTFPTTPPHSPISPVPPSLPPKGLTLQDIAIMPTQRVARYVMLYQDLLKTTPSTSRSYPVVSEARACALRIAKSCNEAQRNLDLVSP